MTLLFTPFNELLLVDACLEEIECISRPWLRKMNLKLCSTIKKHQNYVIKTMRLHLNLKYAESVSQFDGVQKCPVFSRSVSFKFQDIKLKHMFK